MVSRCGFYVKDNTIVQRIVQIDWDLGFDKDAKHTYIHRILRALGEDVRPAVDVTSASFIPEARQLSPIFVRVKGSTLSVEEFLKELQGEVKTDFSRLPGLTDFVYLSSLSEKNIETAVYYNCFVDVFHNPAKTFGNTQAFSLAVLKLLMATDNMSKLNSLDSFLDWFKDIKIENEYR